MGANASGQRKLPHPHANILARYSGINILNKETHMYPGKEKKKKLSKLATLKKKLTRVRKHCRSVDHSKVIKELTNGWTVQELSTLVEDYEATSALKELTLLASLARPSANTVQKDLSKLFDSKYCTDVDLLYDGTCFPVHRAILCGRCRYFYNLLRRYPGYGIQVPVEIQTPGVDEEMFSSLLRYLYTGEFNSDSQTQQGQGHNYTLLLQLADEFGTPKALDHDLRMLLETGEFSDAILVFTSDLDMNEITDLEPSKKVHELHCHKAILAARSPFFRNLLLRRAKSGEEITDQTLQTHTRIVLDESVLPKQYARVLLNAVYMGSVDFSAIIRSSSSVCSLSEVQAIVAGKGQLTTIDEAMEIYSIGQFLEFPRLSQGCEDVIAENLNIENLVSILQWSSEPHGSLWVHRQALHFLQEEFQQVAHSSTLFDLDKQYLIETLQSDFLQCGELEVLSSVIKWGEHQLIKRIEEREPNLLSHTTHSISRKGVKKRDLNDGEFRSILSELLPYVRMDHIIPHHNDVLNSALKRGLVSHPPSHLLADDSSSLLSNRRQAWIRSHNNSLYLKPRLFVPYYEEIKSLLEDQISQVQDNELVRLRMWNNISSIPDTLYMVDDRSAAMFTSQQAASSSSISPVDIIAGTIPVPDQATLQALKQRERELEKTALVQRAHSLACSDRQMIHHQIQLQVVREHSLPDSTVEILQSRSYIEYESPGLNCKVSDQCSDMTSTMETIGACPMLLEELPPHEIPQLGLFRTPSIGRRSFNPSPVTSQTSRRCSPVEAKASTSSNSDTLSEFMPDIAMATASLSIQEQADVHQGQDQVRGQLELDLGDGCFSGGTMYV